MKNDYEIWLKRSVSNLYLAKLRNITNIVPEDLCFNAHQSAEKALKALIVFFDEQPLKTHNLRQLCDQLKKHVEVPDHCVNNTKFLDPYAVAARYPDDDIVIDEDTYNLAINAAEEFLKWVTSKIQHLLKQQEKTENMRKTSENCD
jgi:HEPN domain-containing protein